MSFPLGEISKLSANWPSNTRQLIRLNPVLVLLDTFSVQGWPAQNSNILELESTRHSQKHIVRCSGTKLQFDRSTENSKRGCGTEIFYRLPEREEEGGRRDRRSIFHLRDALDFELSIRLSLSWIDQEKETKRIGGDDGDPE